MTAGRDRCPSGPSRIGPGPAVLILTWFLALECSGRAGTGQSRASPRRSSAGLEAADRLHGPRFPAPDGAVPGWPAQGPGRGRRPAGGPRPGPADRVPLVRRRRVLLALPARGPLRRRRRPAARLRAAARRRLERPLCRGPIRAGGPARRPGDLDPGRPPWAADRARGRDGRRRRERPLGRSVQDPGGSARRVPPRRAARRLARRRLRRLVPARAPAARPATRARIRAPRALEHGLRREGPGCAAPGGDQPGPGPARRVRRGPEDLRRAGRAVSGPVHGGGPAGESGAGDLAAGPRPRRAGREHGPRQPALFRARRRIARASTWSWRGPWPIGWACGSGSIGSMSIARPRWAS